MDIGEQVELNRRQTNYTETEANDKLLAFDFDIERVIRDYMGVKEPIEQIKSSNQERYKMIRESLDKRVTK